MLRTAPKVSPGGTQRIRTSTGSAQQLQADASLDRKSYQARGFLYRAVKERQQTTGVLRLKNTGHPVSTSWVTAFLTLCRGAYMLMLI